MPSFLPQRQLLTEEKKGSPGSLESAAAYGPKPRLAACASRELPGEAEPSRWHRLFWAIALAVLPATLMPLGEVKGEGKTGLEALKTAALLVSLPLLAVYLLLAMSIVRRFGGRRP